MPGCSNCTGNKCKDNNCTRKQSGGLKKTFYLANRCEVESYDKDPITGVITGINFIAGGGWYKVTTIKDTSSAVEDLVAGVLTYNQTVTLTITNFSNNADNAVAWMEAKQFTENWVNAEDGIILLAELRSPALPTATYVLYGQEAGLEITAAQKTTGVVIGDQAATTLTFTAGEGQMASTVDAAYVATLPVLCY
ncbi:hypothetical protein EKK58_11320 [Candidatus Dependentiae bacterium]|nr:MAG: hypothetical protein EKK58_11320 [Candidatus Dependentiae bacterium]